MVLPILFNMEMVRAILDGRKTVTRRICKDGIVYSVPDMSFCDADKRTYAVHGYADKEHTDKVCLAEYTCPICPGDILYVRETWTFATCIECNMGDSLLIRCRENPVTYDDGDSISEGCFVYRAEYPEPQRICWHPSIHMPKQAARIWLKVTDVRVERLWDMKLDDFLNEGVVVRPEAFNDPENAYLQARNQFSNIWDSTIKKRDFALHGWDADPWVWVIKFERCEKPESEV